MKRKLTEAQKRGLAKGRRILAQRRKAGIKPKAKARRNPVNVYYELGQPRNCKSADSLKALAQAVTKSKNSRAVTMSDGSIQITKQTRGGSIPYGYWVKDSGVGRNPNLRKLEQKHEKAERAVLKELAKRGKKKWAHKNPRRSSFGRANSHVIVALHYLSGDRVKKYYFDGETFDDDKRRAHKFPSYNAGYAKAEALMPRVPDSVEALIVEKL